MFVNTVSYHFNIYQNSISSIDKISIQISKKKKKIMKSKHNKLFTYLCLGYTPSHSLG